MTELLKCIDPAQVDDADYLAAIAADARPNFNYHLEQCQFCQNELESYRMFDRQMHQHFGFITGPARALCVEAHRLGDFILGLLSQVETKKVDEHLKHCQFCSAEVSDLTSWLTDSADPLLSLTQPGSGASRPGGWLRKVVATLLNVGETTGRPNYALAGVRGGTEGLPHTYQAEEVSITVTIQTLKPYSKEWMVLGLVQRDNHTMEAIAGVEVRICESGQTLATETIDELGNFVFAEVTPPDLFDLEIALEDKVVLVPHLKLN